MTFIDSTDYGLALIHHAAANDGLQHPRAGNLLHGARQIIAVNDDQIAELADFQAAFLLLLMVQVGVVDGVQPQRFLARQALFGVE